MQSKDDAGFKYWRDFQRIQAFYFNDISEKLQAKINYLYFDIGLTKTQICRLLNFTTYIEDIDLNNYLTKFLPPGINTVNS